MGNNVLRNATRSLFRIIDKEQADDCDKQLEEYHRAGMFGLLSRALLSSVSVYGVAVAYLHAKSSRSKSFDFNFPVKSGDFLRYFRENYDELQKMDEVSGMYLDAVRRFLPEEEEDQMESVRSLSTISSSRSSLNYREEMATVSYEVFSMDGTSGLVYMISVDRNRQEFRLAFRGSVTNGDWWANLSTRFVRLPNKLYERTLTERDAGIINKIPQGRVVGIHRGFYSYLFSRPKHETPDGKNLSKYERSMSDLNSYGNDTQDTPYLLRDIHWVEQWLLYLRFNRQSKIDSAIRKVLLLKHSLDTQRALHSPLRRLETIILYVLFSN